MDFINIGVPYLSILSFRDEVRCKHFLINAQPGGGYQLLGAVELVHRSLNHLVEYHRCNNISVLGREKLLYPCGQHALIPDHQELFVNIS